MTDTIAGRSQTRQAYRTAELPLDLARDMLDGMADLRGPTGLAEDDSAIVD